ncbi:hypothetical protein EVAR_61063_1 [Eumeta japonica]|uniref:Uncharacterized protein n=1 Tax=Eumeta variegata TaxID=151549 RepID=A0A4C1Z9U1_EUMVA|nr:hypothetical protein EVAR_61063_1 [Eumeta japonica]
MSKCSVWWRFAISLTSVDRNLMDLMDEATRRFIRGAMELKSCRRGDLYRGPVAALTRPYWLKEFALYDSTRSRSVFYFSTCGQYAVLSHSSSTGTRVISAESCCYKRVASAHSYFFVSMASAHPRARTGLQEYVSY